MKKLMFLTLALSLLAWQGCKPEPCIDHTNPACENYDPCWDQEPVSAAFHLYERRAMDMPDDWVDYDTDTLCGPFIEFTALEGNAEYEWHLGAETIRTRSFVRRGFPEGIPLTVTLIMRKTPNATCFPDDDGIDTLTRTFVSYRSIINCREGQIITPIGGRYEGVFDSEPEVLRQIEVMPCGTFIIPRGQPDTVLRPGVLGLLPMENCGQWNIFSTGPSAFGYRQWCYWAENVFTEEEEDCFVAYYLRLFQPLGTDSLYVAYRATGEGEDHLKPYQFRGKKIN